MLSVIRANEKSGRQLSSRCWRMISMAPRGEGEVANSSRSPGTCQDSRWRTIPTQLFFSTFNPSHFGVQVTLISPGVSWQLSRHSRTPNGGTLRLRPVKCRTSAIESTQQIMRRSWVLSTCLAKSSNSHVATPQAKSRSRPMSPEHRCPQPCLPHDNCSRAKVAPLAMLTGQLP